MKADSALTLTCKAIVALVLVSLISCRKEPVEAGRLSLTDKDGKAVSELTLPSGKSKTSVYVKSNSEWVVNCTSGEDWIGLSATSGNEDGYFFIEAGPNISDNVRKGTVTVSLKDNSVICPIEILQASDKPYMELSDTKIELSDPGQTAELSISTNVGSWNYKIENGDWLTVEKTEENILGLKVSGPIPMNEDLTAKIVFGAESFPEVKAEAEIVLRKALMLDVVFRNDGTAYDASGWKRKIETIPGSALATYYSPVSESYIARFNHTAGAGAGAGYYKMDYAADEEFKAALADGHSLETTFMFDSEIPGNVEVKMFSAMESGGTGFLITTSAKGCSITFLPNVSKTGSSSWIWTNSNIQPERGKYYHVIGVWDKKNAKSRIYINGELKAETAAEGNLVFPTNQNCHWFGVGGDAGSGTAQCAWRGDIVTARVYDAVLDEETVAGLWKEADKAWPEDYPGIDNVKYLDGCEMKPGAEFIIAGTGFKEGDKISLQSSDDENYIGETVSTLNPAGISLTLPADISTGTYKILLSRGELSTVLGSVSFTISGDPQSPKAPAVIAHRGAHLDGIPENSIAALEKAQQLGVYGSEMDVWITTDNRIVIYHDASVNGINIEKSSYADLAGVTLSNGEKLPTLESYIEQAKKNTATKLIIEIKTHSSSANNIKAADEVMRIVGENGMDDHVEYIAFNLDICKHIASSRPDAVVGYLNGDLSPAQLKEFGIKCIDYQYSKIYANRGWIKEAHDNGMLVNSWTVNSENDMMNMMSYGSDYITTDQPDTLLKLIGLFFKK